jgi:hypothetical protein
MKIVKEKRPSLFLPLQAQKEKKNFLKINEESYHVEHHW